MHRTFAEDAPKIDRGPRADRARHGLLRRWLRLVRQLLVWFGLALIIVLYTPATEWLGQPLYEPQAPVAKADAIVVMEAWAFDDGELNESGIKRALRGVELYRAGVAETVVLTGLKATAARTGSALDPMARVLAVGGVPSQAVVMEGASTNTHESAVHVAALFRAHGWTRVALGSITGWHRESAVH